MPEDSRGFNALEGEAVFNQIMEFLEQYSEKTSGDWSGYWYPLCTLKKETPVKAFDLNEIYKNGAIDEIKAVFDECGIIYAFSFQMQDRKLENKDMQALIFETDEDGYTFPWYIETYYFDKSREWMIYISHEGTITYTGKQLAEAAVKHIEQKYFIGGRG